jgi:opacity protein-like surface antigen
MWKRTSALCLYVVLWSVTPAAAQRLELSGIFAWTLSDGVDGDGVLAGDGNIYDEVSTTDSASWGLSAGYHVNERFEVGFLFNQQMSTLEVGGTATREVGDIDVSTYHPYLSFNFGDPQAAARPYFLIGFGATHFSSVSFTAFGAERQTGSETQFSTTWGAGIKLYPAQHVGIRAGVLWTPTYIKTDSEGWWCDPYWGCYVVGDPQYSNQFQFSGGVTARF